MNFGLVMPKYVLKGQSYEFNYGLSIISACLKQRKYNVFCLNLNHYDEPVKQQINEFITSNNIDVIATGGMSIHYNQINEILKATKEINPNIITITGGSIVTSNPKIVCWGIKYLDYGVIGEGEETIIELADALTNKKDVSSIKGLSYFVHDKYIFTEERQPISNLDTAPFPDREGFEYETYMKYVNKSSSCFLSIMDTIKYGSIMTARSCAFACTFCYHYHLSKYRQRSLDNVFQEIDYLVKTYNINFLAISDEMFAYDKKRMYDFAIRIKPYNIKWWINLRVPNVNKEILETLKDSGLFMVSYGIESMNDDVLKSMKKHITRKQIETALKLTYEANLGIQGNIIVGDIAETEETFKESITFLREHPEYGLNIVMIRTYPFAGIYKYAVANGLIKDEFKHMVNGFPLINLTKMSDKKYKEISIFVENFEENLSYHTRDILISSKITSKTSTNKNLYTFKIKCPKCNEISEYKNFSQPDFKPHFVILCKKCFIRLKIETQKVYSQNYSLYDKIISSVQTNIRKRVNSNRCFFYLYYFLRELKHKNLIPGIKKYI